MSKIDDIAEFSKSVIRGPGAPLSYRVSGADTLRVKAFNSWPQAEQVVTTSPSAAVAGPENFQFKLVVKFVRAADPNTEVTCTKIGTMDNDRALNGVASAGILALPFGKDANKERKVTDANCTFNSRTISSFSVANPTLVTTSAGHGFTTGDLVLISGSTSTPNADGLWYVQNGAGSTFNIALNVSVTGTGTVVTSKTLTSATAAFTVGDVGKNITLSVGGQTGNSDGTWGTGGPFAGLTPTAACQGPKFPFKAGNPINYEGTITGFTNSTTVTIKPSLVVNPNGTGVLKLEPIMLADSDGLEFGDGWVVGVDINFWQGTPKPGQARFEVEINKGLFNMHEGVTLIPASYLETSGHLSWPSGRPGPTNSLTGHGYTRTVTVANPSAGAEWTITCPTNAHWKLLGVRATLAAVGAANRNPVLLLDDGSANVWSSPPATTAQVAATTVSYSWAPGLFDRSVTPAAGNIQACVSIPFGAEFQEGGRIRVSTPGLQVGDTWTAINALVEEWIIE